MLDHFLADLACFIKRAASMRVVPARAEEKANPIIDRVAADIRFVFFDSDHRLLLFV
jgi:hypothetical protein